MKAVKEPSAIKIMSLLRWESKAMEFQLAQRASPMRPNAIGLAQHGGPPGWLEESDPYRMRFCT